MLSNLPEGLVARRAREWALTSVDSLVFEPVVGLRKRLHVGDTGSGRAMAIKDSERREQERGESGEREREGGITPNYGG